MRRSFRKSKNPAEHLFTDFTYDNLGLPRNGAIPANADSRSFDLGLCGPARKMRKGLSSAVCGAFKVPTLRNAAQRPFYFHNGSFTDLTEVVRFYVERDTHPEKWYPKDANGRLQVFNDLPARYARNVNREESRTTGNAARSRAWTPPKSQPWLPSSRPSTTGSGSSSAEPPGGARRTRHKRLCRSFRPVGRHSQNESASKSLTASTCSGLVMNP